MKTAYFDCFNGAAGDMILGALIDAGAPPEELHDVVSDLGIGGFRIGIERVMRNSLAAVRFDVCMDAGVPQPHRHLNDIRAIVETSRLPQRVCRRAVRVFERLARAEARVHDTSPDAVHFHEVGAVDAVIDIVGICWAIERLGIERVTCSPIPVGSGTVRCAHGVLPVPAPATALLLQGVPVAAGEQGGELTTPTGAAVLTELSAAFGPMPPMVLSGVGVGAGRREGGQRPNVLRVLLGDTTAVDSAVVAPSEGLETDRIVVLEASIDDSTPEVLGHVVERLLESGALDAYCMPIYMKKSRPAMLLTALADATRVAELETIIFSETTTFGIRRRDAWRTKLARRIDPVETPYGSIRVKVGLRADRAVTASPEYDDCREAAIRCGVALRVVMDAALDAWRRHPAQMQAQERPRGAHPGPTTEA